MVHSRVCFVLLYKNTFRMLKIMDSEKDKKNKEWKKKKTRETDMIR